MQHEPFRIVPMNLNKRAVTCSRWGKSLNAKKATEAGNKKKQETQNRATDREMGPEARNKEVVWN